MRCSIGLMMLVFAVLLLPSGAAPGTEAASRPWPGPARKIVARLVGDWYVGGDAAKRCTMADLPEGLVATEESGHSSKIAASGPRDIVAIDWAGGIEGTVRGDIILWRNGTWWTKKPFPVAVEPK